MDAAPPLVGKTKVELMRVGLDTNATLRELFLAWNVNVSSFGAERTPVVADSFEQLWDCASAGDVVAMESVALLSYYGLRTRGLAPNEHCTLPKGRPGHAQLLKRLNVNLKEILPPPPPAAASGAVTKGDDFPQHPTPPTRALTGAPAGEDSLSGVEGEPPWMMSSKSLAVQWWQRAAKVGSVMADAALCYVGTGSFEADEEGGDGSMEEGKDAEVARTLDNDEGLMVEGDTSDGQTPSDEEAEKELVCDISTNCVGGGSLKRRKLRVQRSSSPPLHERTIDIGEGESGITLRLSRKRRNVARAFHLWSRLAEETGDRCVLNFLGLMHDRGEGTPKDPRMAQALYSRAAALGFPPAMNNLAVVYELGEGVNPDIERAWTYYQAAADMGHPKAVSNLALGWEYGQNPAAEKDHAQALRLFHQAVLLGDKTAIYNLAECYSEGNGVEKDLERAKAMYSLLIKDEEGRAYYSLAMLYLNSAGEEGTNETERADCGRMAVDLLTLGIEQDHATSLNHLGYIYHYGAPGVERNFAAAVALYRIADERNDPYAQFSLGFMYKHGQGLTRDVKMAKEYVCKSARQKFGPALMRLALMYKLGDGVDQDYVRYMSLLTQAVAENETKALREFPKAAATMLFRPLGKITASEAEEDDDPPPFIDEQTRMEIMEEVFYHLPVELWATVLLPHNAVISMLGPDASSSSLGMVTSLVRHIATRRNAEGARGLDVLLCALRRLRKGIELPPSASGELAVGRSHGGGERAGEKEAREDTWPSFILENQLHTLERAVGTTHQALNLLFQANLVVMVGHLKPVPPSLFAFLPLELVLHVLSFLRLPDFFTER